MSNTLRNLWKLAVLLTGIYLVRSGFDDIFGGGTTSKIGFWTVMILVTAFKRFTELRVRAH